MCVWESLRLFLWLLYNTNCKTLVYTFFKFKTHKVYQQRRKWILLESVLSKLNLLNSEPELETAAYPHSKLALTYNPRGTMIIVFKAIGGVDQLYRQALTITVEMNNLLH